jgi:hypothetical protein
MVQYLMKNQNTENFVFKVFILSALLSSNAHAYVDGGTALLLLQGAFAAIGAVLVFFKKPLHLIAKLFRWNKKTDA